MSNTPDTAGEPPVTTGTTPPETPALGVPAESSGDVPADGSAAAADEMPLALPGEHAAAEAGTGAGPDSAAAPAGSAMAGGAGHDGSARVALAGPELEDTVEAGAAPVEREVDLPARRDLLKLFVTDDQLLALWNEIGRLEVEVVELHWGSSQVVADLIDQLAAARNRLLHSRDEYDDVLREVALVRHRVLMLSRSSALQQAWVIQVYLTLFLVALAVAIAKGQAIIVMLGNPASIAGLPTGTLWNTLLWGGIGGVTGGLWALMRHLVDYDPQNARWYYVSPLVGLIFGPLVALVADAGLPALVQLVGTTSTGMDVRPAVLYLLAWLVGFQQNVLLALVRSVLKQILPADESADAPPRVTAETTATSASTAPAPKG